MKQFQQRSLHNAPSVYFRVPTVCQLRLVFGSVWPAGAVTGRRFVARPLNNKLLAGEGGWRRGGGG